MTIKGDKVNKVDGNKRQCKCSDKDLGVKTRLFSVTKKLVGGILVKEQDLMVKFLSTGTLIKCANSISFHMAGHL